MITTLTIIFFILLLLIVVFFVIGSFRLRGKTVGIYEKLTSYLDNKLEDKTKKIENFSKSIIYL
jgi:Na+-transporting methylmalonyl-CoA/oxaloacetate decarboxylase gamma subunit